MSRHWMPLYVGDYQRDTMHLSTLEHGAYILLIMHYWERGGLPDNDRQLSRITRLSFKQWMAIRPTMVELFHKGWKHLRIEQEIARAEHVKRVRRLASLSRKTIKINGSHRAFAQQKITQSQSHINSYFLTKSERVESPMAFEEESDE